MVALDEGGCSINLFISIIFKFSLTEGSLLKMKDTHRSIGFGCCTAARRLVDKGRNQVSLLYAVLYLTSLSQTCQVNVLFLLVIVCHLDLYAKVQLYKWYVYVDIVLTCVRMETTTRRGKPLLVHRLQKEWPCEHGNSSGSLACCSGYLETFGKRIGEIVGKYGQ